MLNLLYTEYGALGNWEIIIDKMNQSHLYFVTSFSCTHVYFCILFSSAQFCHMCCCSVAQLRPTLCNPMGCSVPGCPVLHQLPGLAQTHVLWVDEAIQPSHPLLSPPTPALNLSQHQGLFQWVCSSHQVVKVLQFELQHQPFQWIFQWMIFFRIDWLEFLAV